MVSEWQSFVATDSIVDRMLQVGFPNEIVEAAGSLLSVIGEGPSYAHFVVSDGSGDVPSGRLMDTPYARVVPSLGVMDYTRTHFPITELTENLESMARMLTDEIFSSEASGTTFYALGGEIPFSHDQTTSLSPTRRLAGFLKTVPDDAYRSAYYDIFYGNGDGTPFVGNDFPGSSCHNHALAFEMGPLKTDWTKACPTNWTQAERDEKCISQQEAAWGTTNLVRLQDIKSVVDPNGLFVCASGIGYTTSTQLQPSPTPAPAPEPFPEPSPEPSAEPSISAATSWKMTIWSFYLAAALLIMDSFVK